MITIGLTGGIASSKSEVTRLLRECGAYLVDVRFRPAPPYIMKAVVQHD